jgi:tetratricopeptide (TPR) repeat protein
MRQFCKYLAPALLVAIAVSTPLIAQDWAGGGRIKGTVVNEALEPIQGAEIRLKWKENEAAGPEPIYTDKKGRWSYIGLKPGFWMYEIYAEGYRPFREQVEIFQNTVASPAKAVLREVSEEVKDAKRRTAVNEQLQQGIDLAAAGQYAEARVAYEKALARMTDEEKPMVLTGIADSYVQEGDHEAGIAKLEEALALDPDQEQALKLIIAVLVAEEREDEAEQYIARLPEGADLDPNAEMNLGILAYNDGNMEEAARIFEALVAEHPDIADAQYFAGLVHLNQGKNAEALAELRKMMELAPDHEKAEEVRGFIEYLESVE